MPMTPVMIILSAVPAAVAMGGGILLINHMR
jgi:hypothetical protein